MNPDEQRAHARAEKAAQAARKRLMERTRSELVALLKDARAQTVLVLAGAPSDYQQWRATALQAEIDRVLAELGRASGDVLSAAATAAWNGGAASIDDPLAAAGFPAAIVQLDTTQLMAMRTFMVDRIDDIAEKAASIVRRELGLAMIGSQSLQQTIGNVSAALGQPSISRATTIVRTELGRAWAVAANERARQYAESGTEMVKVWRRSGKVHSRLAHDLADGQRVPLDQPFKVAGIAMMHPHDPKAPASQTINCGCIALYRPAGTSSRLPDQRPFTREELNANPYKVDLEKLRQ